MRREIMILMVAGLVSGLVVLGVGGRLLMRLLAFLTPEAPRFSWLGSIQIAGAGAVWGTVTGPLLVICRSGRWSRWSEGPLFGLLVLALAIPPFLILSGFSGTIVAPASFLWASSITFPILFMVHGVLVRRLASR